VQALDKVLAAASSSESAMITPVSLKELSAEFEANRRQNPRRSPDVSRI
jgi:hypothetical protein